MIQVDRDPVESGCGMAWMLTTTGSEGSGAPSGGGSIRVQPDAPNRYRAEEHASTTMCDPAGAP